MSFAEKVAKGLWEFFHALDGVWVCWKPFSIRHEPPRWEDRIPYEQPDMTVIAEMRAEREAQRP
jgi:hypothetical protein